LYSIVRWQALIANSITRCPFRTILQNSATPDIPANSTMILEQNHEQPSQSTVDTRWRGEERIVIGMDIGTTHSRSFQ
jgi:hypothetical protein